MGEINLPTGYLSHTQVAQYTQCPACYELRYVQKIKAPLSVDALIGRAFHAAVEEARKNQMAGHTVMYIDSLRDSAVDAFNTDLQAADPESGAEVQVDLGKWATVGEARDMAVRLVDQGLPQLLELDRQAGLAAIEQRVFGLGAAMDDQEEAYYRKTGAQPIFPFKFYARLDAFYRNGSIKDVKTTGKRQAPPFLQALQLALEMAPWLRSGYDLKGGIDQVIKYKSQDIDLQTYWVNVDQEALANAESLVNWVANRISAGDFPPRPDWSCKFEHQLPNFSLAVSA